MEEVVEAAPFLHDIDDVPAMPAQPAKATVTARSANRMKSFLIDCGPEGDDSP